jgi:hypothetical protein
MHDERESLSFYSAIPRSSFPTNAPSLATVLHKPSEHIRAARGFGRIEKQRKKPRLTQRSFNITLGAQYIPCALHHTTTHTLSKANYSQIPTRSSLKSP